MSKYKMTEPERNEFKADWDKTVNFLKKSNQNLSKIMLYGLYDKEKSKKSH